MKILSIETSADETAVSVVNVQGDFPTATYTLLGNAIRSQVETHNQYGGIFPMVAKREHAAAFPPLLKIALEEANLLHTEKQKLSKEQTEHLHTLLHREEGAADKLIEILENYSWPEFDLIAVTSGPGLEPALWVGINFAKALAHVWQVPVVPVNHMEGHVLAAIYDNGKDEALEEMEFPAIALLVSGGHTELVLMKGWGQYEKIGETRDDAVGEAFDKVARLLGLPYPGGPEIGKLAQKARVQELPLFKDEMPRPMLNSDDFDFSFSGLKTAVRYAVAGQDLSDDERRAVAKDFENAAIEVLVSKTVKAVEQYGARAVVVGGGVSANQYLRQEMQKYFLEDNADVEVHFPTPGLSTDNSVMIALAGHAKLDSALSHEAANELIKADGNKSI
ncbi:tRNA (adenosine(37)-N6)-threonylcarbamoyltransferase complex transferase subunit TsaD [bacterium]|mgnify:CR=1 FL=1|nr:tRNA (adenosine(37)-N6)-threonylcarbamoyltransferase complex transferase subunit TsaD [bacterium]|tara:strand:+ start:60 stop:1235 length:1176 start_codon:yes stop_codon:yes gene_type:complete